MIIEQQRKFAFKANTQEMGKPPRENLYAVGTAKRKVLKYSTVDLPPPNCFIVTVLPLKEIEHPSQSESRKAESFLEGLVHRARLRMSAVIKRFGA